MPAPAMPPESAALSIAAVERETGVAKDTLRVWEKRYGFPAPLRDAAGDRMYPMAQVLQLKLIRRLLDAGMRPGKVVGLDNDALQALLDPATPESATQPTPPQAGDAPQVPALLDAIAAHDPQALRHALLQAQWRRGLAHFVTEVVAPLTTAVGDAWAQGRFEIFEEHLYTEVITGVLRSAIATLAMPPASQGVLGPRVLLTTVQREPHGLGLLMLEALLALEGCTCISLGTQTPLGDIVQAAQAHRADVVALSFTNLQSGPVVLTQLHELRRQLPPERALWVGGACSALYQKPLPGITAVQGLSQLAPWVAQWRYDNAAR
ncbi:MerR family transcriptional regulator [Simplicispira psychrophila]|uniref:MerR family transcriptional regulator n=1 Tax=Simplicispira psychrophila TaxID=80882 RepID=UPI000480D219|nr:MerR family transcriptional regulator [Simplicispira psychrophila]